MNPDLYDVLEVNKDATQEDIKKAYRRKAAKSHPDVGGDSEEFKVLTTAFEVLSDSTRRKQYDETGHTERPSTTEPEDILIMFFNQVVEDLLASEQLAEHVDLVGETRSKIKNRILQSSKIKRQGLKALAKVKVILKRLSTDNEDDVLVATLKSREATYERKLKDCDREKTNLQAALELLDSYSYTKDKKPESTSQFMSHYKMHWGSYSENLFGAQGSSDDK